MAMPWFMELESTAKAFEWFADRLVEIHGENALVTPSVLRHVSDCIREDVGYIGDDSDGTGDCDD